MLKIGGGYMKRIWLNKEYIAKITSTIIGGLYAFLGFIGTLVPLDELLSSSLSIWVRVGISISILAGGWLICFVVLGLILSNKKRFDVITANNGHKLYLQYGDLFNEKEVINPSERRNIVIPVNRCFDTIVDNHLISERTLHGMAFKKLYSKNLYTEESLNSVIQQLLMHKKFENVTDNEKPVGNKKRYPVGTVIDLPCGDKEHYLLWALSTFDSDLKARTTMQDYFLAVQKLIEACNTESEGFPIVLPIVGTGLSRTKKDENDVIKYLLNSFRLNKNEINCDIHLVIHEDIKSEVAIMNIK